MRRPRRYRLRLYVAAARSILWVLNCLSDWEINRMYPDAGRSDSGGAGRG